MRGKRVALMRPCPMTRKMKFLITAARTCTGILWRQPRFTVNRRRTEVAPIELLADSRRLVLGYEAEAVVAAGWMMLWWW